MLEAPGIAATRADKSAAALRLTSEPQPLRMCAGHSLRPGGGGPCFCDIEQMTMQLVYETALDMESGMWYSEDSHNSNQTLSCRKIQWIFQAHCDTILYVRRIIVWK